MAKQGNIKKGFGDLNRRIGNLAKAMATTFPRRASAQAVSFYKDSFKYQGFTDRTLVKWEKKADPKARPDRVLRGKTGLLSISVRPLKADYKSIVITAGGPHVPYAKIHNEGGTISGPQSVRAHSRRAHKARTRSGKRVSRKEASVGAYTRRVNTKIPKRQFIGKSERLKEDIQATAVKTIHEAWNK